MIIILMVIIIPILALVNIVLSAQVSHLGFKIAELNQQKDLLHNHNQHIEQEIFKLSALTHIHQQAESLGYSTDNQYISLPGTLPVAFGGH